MASRSFELPSDYKPFQRLMVCGNNFINGEVPVSVGGKPAFLVGQGAMPLLWLWAFEPRNRNEPQPVVLANRVSFQVLTIDVTIDHLLVRLPGGTIIDVRVEAVDRARIVELDLRPIGINIWGNESMLAVGTNQLVGNTFRNVRTMVAVGE
jgi:hypothetical protein